jgi:hypothetical protein
MCSSSADHGNEGYYCADCGWWTDIAEEPDKSGCTKRAIRHHVETTHTVVHQSVDQPVGSVRSWLADDRL